MKQIGLGVGVSYKRETPTPTLGQNLDSGGLSTPHPCPWPWKFISIRSMCFMMHTSTRTQRHTYMCTAWMPCASTSMTISIALSCRCGLTQYAAGFNGYLCMALGSIPRANQRFRVKIASAYAFRLIPDRKVQRGLDGVFYNL